MSLKRDGSSTSSGTATNPSHTPSSSRRPTPSSESGSISDDGLPPLPYVPGATFEIKAHVPPPPFDNGQWYEWPDRKIWNRDPWPDYDGVPKTMLDRCLKHPPRKTEPPKEQTVRHLKITDQIRCGDGYNAQLVKCCLLEDPGLELVAKIFDPLYIGCGRYFSSPTHYAERFYSCEAAAYMRIDKVGLGGKFTPRFHGCWSFEVPVPTKSGAVVHREVRLILQEFIKGITMEESMGDKTKQDPIRKEHMCNIPPPVRKNLLGQLLEAYSELDFKAGVRQEDKYSRNVMVSRGSKNEWRLILIDFSHSRVLGLKGSKWKRAGPKSDKPQSPMAMCSGCWPVKDVVPWVSKEEDKCESRLVWMRKRWGKHGDGSGRYQPFEDEDDIPPDAD